MSYMYVMPSSHVTGMFMIKNESIKICSKHVECMNIYPAVQTQ